MPSHKNLNKNFYSYAEGAASANADAAVTVTASVQKLNRKDRMYVGAKGKPTKNTVIAKVNNVHHDHMIITVNSLFLIAVNSYYY